MSAALTLPISACYLHSPGRATLAEGAAEEFEEITKTPPYADATARFVAHRATVADAALEHNRLRLDVEIETLSTLTPNELLAKAKTALADANAAHATALDDSTNLQTDLEQLLIDLGVAKDTADDAKAAIESGEQAICRHHAVLQLIHAGLAAGARTDDPDGATASDGMRNLSLLLDTFDKKVCADDSRDVGQVLGVDSSVRADLRQSVAVIQNMLDALDPKAKGYRNDVRNVEHEQRALESRRDLFNVFSRTLGTKDLAAVLAALDQPPVLLLALARDVTQARVDRIQVEVEYAKRMRALDEEHVTRLQTYTDELATGITTFETTMVAWGPDREVRTIAEDLIAQANAGDPSAARSLFTFYFLLLQMLDYSVKQKLELDMFSEERLAIDVERELRLSLTQLDERAIYIRRGLEGLVEFHAGGFDAAQADLIIKIAQTLGLGVLIGLSA